MLRPRTRGRSALGERCCELVQETPVRLVPGLGRARPRDRRSASPGTRGRPRHARRSRRASSRAPGSSCAACTQPAGAGRRMRRSSPSLSSSSARSIYSPDSGDGPLLPSSSLAQFSEAARDAARDRARGKIELRRRSCGSSGRGRRSGRGSPGSASGSVASASRTAKASSISSRSSVTSSASGSAAGCSPPPARDRVDAEPPGELRDPRPQRRRRRAASRGGVYARAKTSWKTSSASRVAEPEALRADRVHVAREALDELVPRVGVAGAAAVDELGVREGGELAAHRRIVTGSWRERDPHALRHVGTGASSREALIRRAHAEVDLDEVRRRAGPSGGECRGRGGVRAIGRIAVLADERGEGRDVGGELGDSSGIAAARSSAARACRGSAGRPRRRRRGARRDASSHASASTSASGAARSWSASACAETPDRLVPRLARGARDHRDEARREGDGQRRGGAAAGRVLAGGEPLEEVVEPQFEVVLGRQSVTSVRRPSRRS